MLVFSLFECEYVLGVDWWNTMLKDATTTDIKRDEASTQVFPIENRRV